VHIFIAAISRCHSSFIVGFSRRTRKKKKKKRRGRRRRRGAGEGGR
jgi:hypothetical protein